MIRLAKIHIAYSTVLLENGKLEIPASKITVIRGESGTGKSALLYRIGMMSDDLKYEYYWDNKKVDILSDSKTSQFRKNNIGFVLQENDLLEHLNVEEMIIHHALLSQIDSKGIDLQKLLALVHLEVQLNQNIMTLSLGERQRLAIACSLIKKPKLLILDEPTASLDRENEELIFEILKQLSFLGVTIVIASHSEIIKQYTDVEYTIENHQLRKQEKIDPLKECGKNKDRKIGYPFYKEYAKKYLSYYRFMYILMIMVMTLSLTVCNILTIMVNNALSNSREVLINQFDNKLIVTKDTTSSYINEQYKGFIASVDINNLKNAHPLLKMTTKVDGNDVYIIPYYENDEFGKKLESKFPIEKGVYIDQQTYYKLNLEDGAQKTNIEIEISEFKDKSEIKHTTNTNIEISGVLKKGVTPHYIKGDTNFIYMDNKSMEKIYWENCAAEQFLGYVTIYKSHEELKEAKELFVSNGYNVNDNFTDIESIDELINYYKQLQMIIIIVVFSISLLVNIILSYNLYLKRKKEVAILKISGLKKIQIGYIFLFETLMELMAVLIIVSFSSVALLLALNQMSLDIFKIMLTIEIMYSIIWILVQCVEINYFTSHVKMEKELRNDSLK